MVAVSTSKNVALLRFDFLRILMYFVEIKKTTHPFAAQHPRWTDNVPSLMVMGDRRDRNDVRPIKSPEACSPNIDCTVEAYKDDVRSWLIKPSGQR
jgi:hypothetical protein